MADLACGTKLRKGNVGDRLQEQGEPGTKLFANNRSARPNCQSGSVQVWSLGAQTLDLPKRSGLRADTSTIDGIFHTSHSHRSVRGFLKNSMLLRPCFQLVAKLFSNRCPNARNQFQGAHRRFLRGCRYDWFNARPAPYDPGSSWRAV